MSPRLTRLLLTALVVLPVTVFEAESRGMYCTRHPSACRRDTSPKPWDYNREGWKAHTRGVEYRHNPYPIGDRNAYWGEGWMQAGLYETLSPDEKAEDKAWRDAFAAAIVDAMRKSSEKREAEYQANFRRQLWTGFGIMGTIVIVLVLTIFSAWRFSPENSND